MESPLRHLKDQYDVVIVGGGIVGIGIFRDLCLHNVNCLLIDKGDFASQTSQSSSKMLHGGIRYLEQGDLLLVKEALREKNLWLKMAPHLCKELPFYMPIFTESKHPKWMIGLGLTLYDCLSGFQNSPHRMLNKIQTLKDIPLLKSKGLKGCGIYFDAIMDDSKMALECLLDALNRGNGHAANHIELTKIHRLGQEWELTIQDRLKGMEKIVSAREVVFATGPFTDHVLSRLKEIPWERKLLPSKGSHLWLDPKVLPVKHPVVLQTNDNRVLFVIPQRNSVLVGTTEEDIEGDFFDIKISDREVDYLLKNINEFFPSCNVRREHILSTFAGVRPLLRENGKGKKETSREHGIFNPFHNVHVIVGGKYTTFRTMGQSITSTITERLNITYNSNLSLTPLVKNTSISTFRPSHLDPGMIRTILQYEMPRTFEDLIKRRLGLPGRSHWNHDTGFETFFSTILPELKEHLGTSMEEIRQF